jgi:lipid A 3-O-deacylase
MIPSWTAVLLLAAWLPSPPQAGAPAATRPPWVFSLYVENDVFAGSDDGYTNGVKLVWVSPEIGDGPGEGHPPRWLAGAARRWPLAPPAGARRFLSIFVGQSMYTPADITRTDLIPDDRPYAGIAYAGVGFHAVGERSMDSLEIQAGVVGPHSFAGEIQRLWHRTFGWTRPRGWAHQLRDEPVLGAIYGHKWKVLPTPESPGFGHDAIFDAGGSLSNVITGARAGAEFRAGWNLPRDFGTSFIQPGSESCALFEARDARRAGCPSWGFHVFAALDAQAVVRNIFLDGNTFVDSHRVDKKTFVGGVAAGLAFRYRRLRLNFSYVWRTREFEGQKEKSLFGSFNLSFLFRG